MSHKLQTSPLTNDGSNTVGHNHQQNSPSEIASNDAGLRDREFADSTPEANSDRNSTFSVGQESPQSEPNPGEGKPTQQAAAVPQLPPQIFFETPRCEVARSGGYDPTGEHAVPCGAAAQVLCEHCGPMCLSCADETFCFYGEHRLVEFEAPQGESSEDSQAQPEPSKPLFEVVYLELACPQCDTVRLALPLADTPDADWTLACPICATPTTWTYLAHGVTQRELPFHEVFDRDAIGKGRIPWDQLMALVEEDE